MVFKLQKLYLTYRRQRIPYLDRILTIQKQRLSDIAKCVQQNENIQKNSKEVT